MSTHVECALVGLIRFTHSHSYPLCKLFILICSLITLQLWFWFFSIRTTYEQTDTLLSIKSPFFRDMSRERLTTIDDMCNRIYCALSKMYVQIYSDWVFMPNRNALRCQSVMWILGAKTWFGTDRNEYFWVQ